MWKAIILQWPHETDNFQHRSNLTERRLKLFSVATNVDWVIASKPIWRVPESLINWRRYKWTPLDESHLKHRQQHLMSFSQEVMTSRWPESFSRWSDCGYRIVCAHYRQHTGIWQEMESKEQLLRNPLFAWVRVNKNLNLLYPLKYKGHVERFHGFDGK